MAKKELHHIAALPHCIAVPNLLLGEHWYALAPSGKIMLDPHPVVVELLGRWEVLRYWSHKQQLDATSFDLVHWEPLDTATRSFPPTLQMCLSKFVSGHSAVATTMFCWKCWDTPSCPLCQSADETTTHVLHCPHALSRETWDQQVTQLQSWLTQSDTAPSIQQCLLRTLNNGRNQSFQSYASGFCHPAAWDQDHIGFFGFMTG